MKNIDDYIASQPEERRGILSKVRAAIRKSLPKAEEVISYGMPAYKIETGVAVYFAGWKKHYSLYPAGPRLVDAFREELAGYEISKGTIRFPLDQAVPVKLIGEIAKFRVEELGMKSRRRAR